MPRTLEGGQASPRHSVSIGTSGWSYPGWQPSFYPAGLDRLSFLAHYASVLPVVELNATAYRLPSEEQFVRWASAVPDGFHFAVKAPPGIERRIDTVQDRLRALGDRLGCLRIVVERPRDEGLLELLLGSFDPALRLALDLRHPSWDGVEMRLVAAGAVRVGDETTPSAWRYLRFREPPWSDTDLVKIAQRVHALRATAEVLGFFRHEDAPNAPAAAQRVKEILGES